MEKVATGTAPNLGPKTHGERLSRRAKRRLLALAQDPSLVTTLGGAYGMLLYVVRACGDEDGCVVGYGQVAATCGVSHPAVKVWARKLTDEGLIRKEPLGKRGVRITLRGRVREDGESSGDEEDWRRELKAEVDATAVRIEGKLSGISRTLAEHIEER